MNLKVVKGGERYMGGFGGERGRGKLCDYIILCSQK